MTEWLSTEQCIEVYAKVWMVPPKMSCFNQEPSQKCRSCMVYFWRVTICISNETIKNFNHITVENLKQKKMYCFLQYQRGWSLWKLLTGKPRIIFFLNFFFRIIFFKFQKQMLSSNALHQDSLFYFVSDCKSTEVSYKILKIIFNFTNIRKANQIFIFWIQKKIQLVSQHYVRKRRETQKPKLPAPACLVLLMEPPSCHSVGEKGP